MGTKISALTTTGSAPTDSYVPIAYDGQNYKTSAGNLLDSDEISFRADLGGATQAISTSAATIAALSNEVFDSADKYDPATYRFTPGVAGRYLLTAGVLFLDMGQSAGPTSVLQILKNGVTFAGIKKREHQSGYDVNLTMTTIVEANDTDYFEMAVFHNYSVAVSRNLSDGTYDETWFAGCRI